MVRLFLKMLQNLIMLALLATLAIPSGLQVLSQPVGGIEGLSVTSTPIFAVYDDNGEVVNNFGIHR